MASSLASATNHNKDKDKYLDTNNLETNLVKEKHELFLKELNGFSLWQARHILQCVQEDLESKSVITSIAVETSP